MSRPRLLNFIGGNHTNPKKNKFLSNISPSTSAVINEFPDSTTDDVCKAVEAAQLAFDQDWKHTTLLERVDLCRSISSRLKERSLDFAYAESQDTGKPHKLALQMDVARAIENFNFFADQGVSESSRAFSNDQGLNITMKSPLGVVGLITPWNLPLYLMTWKVAPALIMGNTIVAKPR